jgi:hypothetical protein
MRSSGLRCGRQILIFGREADRALAKTRVLARRAFHRALVAKSVKDLGKTRCQAGVSARLRRDIRAMMEPL